MALLDSIHPVIVLTVGLGGALAISRLVRRRMAGQHDSGRSASGGGRRSSAVSSMLSARQREMVRTAEDLLARGDAVEAAKMFEGLGLHQKAVHAFIQAKQYDEASKILDQTGSPDRAGYMMGAAGQWERALHYFNRAGMASEAAKCLEEMGRAGEAATHWERAGNPREAARCYRQAGHLMRAGRLFIAAGQLEDAADCLSQAVAENQALSLDQEETAALVHFLAADTEVSLFVPLRKALSGQNPSGQTSSQSVA